MLKVGWWNLLSDLNRQRVAFSFGFSASHPCAQPQW
jgi:hypothetical protein